MNGKINTHCAEVNDVFGPYHFCIIVDCVAGTSTDLPDLSRSSLRIHPHPRYSDDIKCLL